MERAIYWRGHFTGEGSLLMQGFYLRGCFNGEAFLLDKAFIGEGILCEKVCYWRRGLIE